MTADLGCRQSGKLPSPRLVTRRVTRGAAPQKGSPEGTSGTRPCLQGIVCYTLETQSEKSKIFLTAGVALYEPGSEESPPLHFAFSGCSPGRVTAAGCIPIKPSPPSPLSPCRANAPSVCPHRSIGGMLSCPMQYCVSRNARLVLLQPVSVTTSGRKKRTRATRTLTWNAPGIITIMSPCPGTPTRKRSTA